MPDPAESQLAYFLDLKPEVEDFRTAVINGFSANPKWLPPKFFYDDAGSKLFDQICATPEYYVTRTEIALMEERADEIAALSGPAAKIIEYGCGSSVKIRALLDALVDPAIYIAIDISREHLRGTVMGIAADYPQLQVGAICADFTNGIALREDSFTQGNRILGFFPGSTIGNQTPSEAAVFLSRVRGQVGDNGALLIGVDLKKDPDILNAAYSDKQGITAAFNLNLLHRMKRELDADIDINAFEHAAFYNAEIGRVEMHLKAARPVTVRVAEHAFSFAAGETVHTENSYKFEISEFQALASAAGFRTSAAWTDDQRLFSIHFLEAK